MKMTKYDKHFAASCHYCRSRLVNVMLHLIPRSSRELADSANPRNLLATSQQRSSSVSRSVGYDRSDDFLLLEYLESDVRRRRRACRPGNIPRRQIGLEMRKTPPVNGSAQVVTERSG